MPILKRFQLKILFILQWILWTPQTYSKERLLIKRLTQCHVVMAAVLVTNPLPTNPCSPPLSNHSSQHHTLQWQEPLFPDVIILVLPLPTAAQGPLWSPPLKPLLLYPQMCFRILLPEVWPHSLEWELPLLRGWDQVLQASEGLLVFRLQEFNSN